MIQLFLKYSPVKYLLVFIVLVVIRVFAYKIGLPMTEPEITWLLVGERMADGFTLYKDIWTDLEPFSAGIYFFLNLLFGKAPFVYFITSLLLVLLQAIMFNEGLNNNKVFKENSSLPAFIYVLFSSLFFDFYTLSPALLGLTFIIIAFNMICFQSRIMLGEERFFYVGLLTGIASLFYMPFAFFLIFAIAAIGLYSSTSIKKQMIMVLAYFFPYIVILIYYFWIDNLGNYYNYAVIPVLNSAPSFLVNFPTLIKILILPLLLLLAATATIVARGKYIHYQYKIIKIAGLWLLTGLLALSVEKVITPSVIILFIPPFTFFTTHLFLLFSKSKIVSEISFLVMFGGILMISFYALKKPDKYTLANLIKTESAKLSSMNIRDKKILVLGKAKEMYINNRLSGPYENWKLSVWQFSDLKKYENVSAIYEIMEINKPDYIIDQENRMENISIVIPVLKKQYERIDSTNIFRRKI